MKNIKKRLFELRDEEYKNFSAALMPTVDKNSVIGVRIPALRKFAKTLEREDAEDFMSDLPHETYEENNLHAFLIEGISDIDDCYNELERFLPYINNWATCDSLSPKVLKTDKVRLLANIEKWMKSPLPYVVRFGIGMLQRYFLDEDFKREHIDKVVKIKSDEYYVNMMCAWFLATALAKQYDDTIGYFEKGLIDTWVHNKAISKACDSYRVSAENKDYLRKLRINKTAE